MKTEDTEERDETGGTQNSNEGPDDKSSVPVDNVQGNGPTEKEEDNTQQIRQSSDPDTRADEDTTDKTEGTTGKASTEEGGTGGSTEKISTEEGGTEGSTEKTIAEEGRTEESTEKTIAEEGRTEESTEKTSADESGTEGSAEKTSTEEDGTEEITEKTSVEDAKTEKAKEKGISEEDKKTGKNAEKIEADESETGEKADDSTEKTRDDGKDGTAEKTDEKSERLDMLSKGIADLQERRAALIEKHLKDGVQESPKFGSADNHLGTMLSGQMSVMFIIDNLRTAVESKSRRKEELKKQQAKLESKVGELRVVLDEKDSVIKEKEEALQKIQANEGEDKETKSDESQTDFDQALEAEDTMSQTHDQIEALKSDIEDKKLQRALLYEQAACMASDKSWKEHELEFLDSLLNAIKDKPEDKELNGKRKAVMTWTLLNEYRKAEHELDVLKYKDRVLEKENEELQRELEFLKKTGAGEDSEDESSDSDEEEQEDDEDKRQLRDSIDDVIKAVKQAQKDAKEGDSGRGSVNELSRRMPNEGKKKQLPPLRKKPPRPRAQWRY